MPRKNYLLIVAFLILLLFGCSKEKSLDPDDSVNNPLAGNWSFVSLNVKGQTIVEVDDPAFDVKTISNFEYTTINNTGTVVITADKFTYSNLSYAVDTTFRGYYYEDNILIDSFDFPLVTELPATSVTTPYKFIPADSIYYSGGSPMNMGGTTVNTQAGGGRFRIENNQLIITTHFLEKRNQTTQGIPQKITGSGVSVATLQKQ
jgi:hypothetical protein